MRIRETSKSSPFLRPERPGGFRPKHVTEIERGVGGFRAHKQRLIIAGEPRPRFSETPSRLV